MSEFILERVARGDQQRSVNASTNSAAWCGPSHGA